MSTLLEIEEAIEALAPPEQRELYRYLGARLVEDPSSPRFDKRAAAAYFLKRWGGLGFASTVDDDSSARESRLMEKHAK